MFCNIESIVLVVLVLFFLVYVLGVIILGLVCY